ncbi:hypothetical protein GCM10010269_33100 [Streptomyces humidus]|uniref:Uncharacterized protein n=1 Tax=Streptomyces humidus TaxID=52259 RepID=A0A918FWU8_9ACTN|nr:hypothetical protein GCM10010269_33100 [Streptomyces humidus]
MLAHRLGGAETGVPGDLVDGQVAGLQQVPGPFDALLGEPLTRADPGLFAEAAGERAHRHGFLSGHVAQLDRLVQAAQRPRAGGGRGRLLRVGHRAFDVLRLAAVAVRGHDGAAGDVVGDGGAVVAAHHVQAQVDPGGDAGRGEYVAVVDEQHVRIDVDLWEEPLETFGVGPVRGGGPAVEVAGGGQDVHAGADGGEAGAGPDEGEGGGELVGQDALLEDRAELVGSRDDHGVGGGQGLGAVRDVDGEVGVRLDGARRPHGAGDDLVQASPLGVPGAAEDAVRDAQFEGEQTVQGEDDDAVGAEGALVVRRVTVRHGPILANAVLRATRSARMGARSSMT